MVAGVEVEAEEAHPEARGEQDNVGDGEADEVFHPDQTVDSELGVVFELCRTYQEIYIFVIDILS